MSVIIKYRFTGNYGFLFCELMDHNKISWVKVFFNLNFYCPNFYTMKIIQFLFLSVILLSCNSAKNEIEKIEIPLKGNNVKILAEIVDFEKFVPLETNPGGIINTVHRIFVTKTSDFLIFDKKGEAIYLFSPEGKFIRKIGKKGNGPEEYSVPLDMAYNIEDDYIYVLGDSKIMIYSSKGNFIKKIKLKFYGSTIWYFHNNLLVHRVGMYNDGFDYSLVKISMNGEIVSNLLPLIPTKGDFNFLPHNNFTYSNNNVRFFRAFDCTVYKYDGNKLLPDLIFDFGNFNAPEDLLSKCTSNKEFFQILQSESYIHSIEEFVESKDYFYVLFRLRDKAFSLYFNKKTGDYLKYFHQNFQDIFFQLGPISATPDFFINIYYPYFKSSQNLNLSFRQKYSKKLMEESVYEEYTKLYSLDIKENPVIILTIPKF